MCARDVNWVLKNDVDLVRGDRESVTMSCKARRGNASTVLLRDWGLRRCSNRDLQKQRGTLGQFNAQAEVCHHA